MWLETVDIVLPTRGGHSANVRRKKDSVEESGFEVHRAGREEDLKASMTTEPETKIVTSVKPVSLRCASISSHTSRRTINYPIQPRFADEVSMPLCSIIYVVS